MELEERARQLHDKATRGITLSIQEQTELDQWYARQDQEESEALGAAASPALAALQARVDDALAQLSTVAQRIQALDAENTALRQEIAILRRQLAQRSTPQPA